MAAKTFNSWFKNLDHITRRNLKAEDVWEAATKAAEEKRMSVKESTIRRKTKPRKNSTSDDIWKRTEQREAEGKRRAQITEREIAANVDRMQQSNCIRSMIKALEMHPWLNTIDDWQRYYEGKYILKLRRRKRK